MRDRDRYALRLIRRGSSRPGSNSCTVAHRSLLSRHWRARRARRAHHPGDGGGGARRLVLMGRSALPPRTTWASIAGPTEPGRRVAAVRALEHAGASVHLLQRRRHRRGRGPRRARPVRGRGVAADRRRRARRRGRRQPPDPRSRLRVVRRVLAPKLPGRPDPRPAAARARPVHRVLVDQRRSGRWPASPTTRRPMPASMPSPSSAGPAGSTPSASSGGRGGTSACTSARSRRDRGGGARPTGVGSITPEHGRRLVRSPARRGRSRSLAVLPADWAMFHAAHRGRVPARFPRRARGRLQRCAPAVWPSASPSAGAVERRRLLETTVRDTLAGVLRLAPEPLDARRPFGSLGLDSLMALELRNRLEIALERSLSATLAWNYPTIATARRAPRRRGHRRRADSRAEPGDRPAAIVGEESVTALLAERRRAVRRRGPARPATVQR